METNLEELLGIIAHNAIVINRQDRSLAQITTAYNEKAQEVDTLTSQISKLAIEINRLKTQSVVLEFESRDEDEEDFKEAVEVKESGQ